MINKEVDNRANRSKGDMYIVLDVRVPKKISRSQKSLFEELDETDLTDSKIESFDKFTRKNDK